MSTTTDEYYDARSQTAMAQNFTIEPPQAFDFHSPSDWTKWLRRFERFRVASGLKEKEQNEQVNMLVYSMGDKADDIFESFKLSEKDAKDYDKVTKTFSAHFIPKINVIFERSRFNTRIQEAGETVEEFVTALYQLVANCGYAVYGNKLEQELIRDRLVIGLLDKRVNEKLQLEENLTLERAIQVARQSEEIKKQCASTAKSSTVDQVKHSRNNTLHETAANSSGPSTSRDFKCYRCGGKTYHARAECPAMNSKCTACGRKGHWKDVCRSTKSIKAVMRKTEESIDSESDSEMHYLVNSVEENSNPDTWTRSIRINNKKNVTFKIDTGADVTVLPPHLASTYPLKESKAKLFGANKTRLNVLGQFEATLSYKKRSITQSLFVVENLQQPLLGRDAIQSLKIIQLINQAVLKDDMAKDVSAYTEFPGLWKGLGTIPGEYTISLNENSKPFAITAPRKIPIPLRKTVEEELCRMQKDGIIQPIEEPTDWCSPMTCVYKPNGKVRICVDLTMLNKSVKREWHPIPSVEHTLSMLAGAKIFSKLDANSGFWQMPLAKKSRKLTTFITPFGRFAFNRLPFGITSAPEVFSRAMEKILRGLPGVVCHMDDILVFAPTKEEHNKRLRAVLDALQRSGLTLNKEKCIFSTQQVTFLGHQISDNGISIDNERTTAITGMSEPTNVTELQRFLGMINFVGRSIPDRSTICKPLNDLLKKDNAWVWTHAQQAAFDRIKYLVTTSPVLAIFDPDKTTTISSDSSGYGLGACLMQKQTNGENRAVAYISRSLSEAEQRYANIEREALGIIWACSKLSHYILGNPFYIETDHKPLVQIFNSKNIDELSPRLQRFKLAMLRFDYSVFYTPGKQLFTADTLSRSPLKTYGPDRFDDDTVAYVQAVVNQMAISDERLAEVFERQQSNDDFIKMHSYIHTSWPPKERLSEELRKFDAHKEYITDINGLLVYKSRVIIPENMRSYILERLHEGHFGINRCRARANDSVWWPGISIDISNMVKRCLDCIQEHVNLKEPLMPTKLPTRPWQKICLDLFKINNRWYVALIDYYSKFLEMDELQGLKTSAVTLFLKRNFARHGIPEYIYSDNGPQFQRVDSAEFARFAKDYGFKHVTSSPKFAQSNGMSEAAVKIAKMRIKKGGDLYKSLLAYNATKTHSGFSPAELLFSRRIRTTVPTMGSELEPRTLPRNDIADRDARQKLQQKANFDRRHKARELSTLQPGQPVWISDKREYGKIVKKAEEPRSYIVETQKGTVRRNRFHLVPAHEIPNSRTDAPDVEIALPTTEIHESNLEDSSSSGNRHLTDSSIAETDSQTAHSPEIRYSDNEEPQQSDAPRSRYGRPIKPRRILDL